MASSGLKSSVDGQPQVIVGATIPSLPPPAITALTTSTSGGSIAASITRYYTVVAVTAAGRSAPAPEQYVVTGAGSANSNTITWTAPAVPSGVSAITGYEIYEGSGSGTELLLASVGASTLTYTDTAAANAAGATPPAYTVDASVYGPVPANTSVKIMNASICNTGTAAAIVNVAVLKSGGNARRIVSQFALNPGETLPLGDYLAGHVLGPGDTLYASASQSTVDLIASAVVFS